MIKKGKLFVISGPAGSGKGTVMNLLTEKSDSLSLSVSLTSRPMLKGEAEGVNYYYVTREQFEAKIAEGEVLEYTEYCGNYYGTPKRPALDVIESGKHLLLEIEVDGAMQVKKKMRNAITVMLTPPDGETLERRLRSRGTETNEVILWRLARAKEEIALMPKYDYSVVNEDGKVKECADLIYSIISAEHEKTKRTKQIIKKFI